MDSKAKIGGHPIHPMLVPLPIGLWLASLAADLTYLARGEIFWYDFAWWTMVGGIGGALLAAIPGLIDYFGPVQRSVHARAVGRVHMGLNLTIVAVYLVNALIIRNGHGALGGGALALAVGLSVVSVVALCASGWLGGELVYRYGVGFSRDAEADVRVTLLGEEKESPVKRR